MAKILPKPIKKLPKTLSAKAAFGKPNAPRLVSEAKGLAPSKLKIFDIPIAKLVAHKENPNEQDESTFDEIVERMRKEGFDEPILVIPEIVKAKPTGKYLIVSGHHRVKAATTLGMTAVPAVIREGWDEDRVAIELISRNQLRGAINPHKFTELYDKLSRRYDPEILKRMMGLTQKKAFDGLYRNVANSLPPKQKAALEEAKENIESIEDLSSVLNTIFKEHGSKVDHSFMVFTFGGKRHHYIQVSSVMSKQLDGLKETLDKRNINAGAFFEALLQDSVKVTNTIGKLSAGTSASKKN